MRLSPGSSSGGRALLLLAPLGKEPTSFVDVIGDREVYGSVLAEMQKFRGQVYVSEGNLESSDLTADGRHLQLADHESWHLLTLDEHGAVAACGRVLIHRPGASFADFLISHCALAHSDGWGYLLQQAVEEQAQLARLQGMHFAEIGGWAVARHLRCTTEAVRLVLAGFALGQLLGGVAGISTANTGHHSSSILRRIGGTPLGVGEIAFPSFYEPLYRAELEILCMDSFRLNRPYDRYVQDCLTDLETATVIASVPAVRPFQHNFVRDVSLRTLASTKPESGTPIFSN
ncbi:MAG TPA: hypothetical protein VH640_09925 [Bryobacteraceae bacterium]